MYHLVMKYLALSVITISFSVSFAFSQSCTESAKEVAPVLSKETEMKYSRELEIAAMNLAAAMTADNVIWYARRKGYTGKYKDAVDALTIALPKFSGDARIYRHRGHRSITLRCFDDAIKDLTKAVKLIKGKPDEIEPDGLPNARNIPTGTLQSNIWYHLGLVYYLKGDLKNAERAYKECVKVSKNNDMLAATTHWYYMTLRRMGKTRDAERLLAPFGGGFEVIENDDYLRLLRLYRGELKPEVLAASLGEKAATLGNASLGYGLGNWYLYNGEKDKAETIFRKLTAGNQWASFGYIAAEAELARQPRK